MIISRNIITWLFPCIAALIFACSDDGGTTATECNPGDLEPCTCADGSEGNRKCKNDGSSWAKCKCDQDEGDAGSDEDGEDASVDAASDVDSDADADIEGAWRDEDS